MNVLLTGLAQTGNISFVLVFLEGVLSFFSPCVIPLIPVYMGYLAGNAKKTGEGGVISYERKKVFLHTLFFVLGISFSFLLLGVSFTALGKYFSGNRLLFTRIGGILIVLLGLFQLGIFEVPFLQRERKIRFSLAEKSVNPLVALLMGFTFSFAWTPCVGPALSSVLIMASGASHRMEGAMLVLVYAAGFLIPFLLLGLFTTQVLAFLQRRKNLLKYTIRAGGVILILMGIMTYTGWMNGVSGYLNTFSNPATTQSEDKVADQGDGDVVDKNTDPANASEKDTGKSTEDTEQSTGTAASGSETKDYPAAVDFTLTDQYGNTHTLSDYKGKVVFLNFWATWCPPCKQEMPHIQALYEEWGENQKDVIFLGVANPKSKAYPNNQDGTKEEITAFLADNGYTFPTVFDETGEILNAYSISAFPTTFMINKEGNVMGYVPGMMTKDIMESVIGQALDSTK